MAEKQKLRLGAHGANKIIVRYAFIAAVSYILYFFIMMAAGLIDHTELRFGNYVLFFITGYYALKTATAKRGGALDYVQGLGIAFVTGSLSFILFGIFVFFYSFFDHFFIDTILKLYPSAFVLQQFSAPFLIAFEGIGMSSILSLCLMQYFKIFTARRRRFLLFGKRRFIENKPQGIME